MDKLLTYPGKTEQGVFNFLIDYDRNYLVKTASAYHPTIAEYINNAKPIPGLTQVLLTALGAGEYWGANVNADFFGEDQLAHEGSDYGYKTFEHHAKVFKHHVNRPNSESFGEVLLSVYNPIYHRVELIVGIRHKNGRDIIEQIENNEPVSWSMGCKIPYDICNICGNKAPNRKFYCEHMRFMLRQIHPETGRAVYAINIKPKFFDISYVLIPADKIALTLKKVAFAYNPGFILDAQGKPIISSAEAAEKAAGMKAATIEKEVPVSPEPAAIPLNEAKAQDLLRAGMEVRAREPSLPAHVLDRLCEKGTLGDVMSTMSSCMIMPKPQEFQRILLIKLDRRDLADRLDQMNACFDPEWVSEPDPQYDDILGLSPHRVNLGMAGLLAPHFEDRSNFGPHLVRRMAIMVKEGAAYPYAPYPVFVTPEMPRKNDNPKQMSPLAILGLGALLYAALSKGSVNTALRSLGSLASRHPLMATAGAVGLLTALTGRERSDETIKGRFIEHQHPFPDAASPYERIESMREKPYIKVGAELPKGRYFAAARRLLIGVPAVQMTSGYLQKRRMEEPYAEEGRVSRFIRKHPDLLSAALVADAMLATQGKGTIALTRHAGDAYHSWLKGGQMKAAAGIVEEESYPELKAASVQDYVSGSIIWPTVLGTANLPGRIVGSFIDQAALDLGSKLISKKSPGNAPIVK